MAAIQMRSGIEFSGKQFYQIATQNLQPYAVPLFVRIVGQMDMTGSFKLRKVDLQQQGYDPAKTGDAVYVLSHEQQDYLPYSEGALHALGVKPFE